MDCFWYNFGTTDREKEWPQADTYEGTGGSEVETEWRAKQRSHDTNARSDAWTHKSKNQCYHKQEAFDIE